MAMADLELMSGEPPATPAAVPDGFARRTFTIAEFFLVALVLVVIALAGRILLMAFGGLLLGVFLYSLAKGVHRVTRLPYGLSLLVVVIALAAIAAGAFWTVGSRLASQANELTEAVSRSLIQIRDYL